MAILSEAFGVVTDLVGIFKTADPTPEEQKAKAGVWYKMLADFVQNEPTPEVLAARWKDQLPFTQKSTKTNFINAHILGQSYDSIVNTLVGKINDELTPDFAAQSKDAILSGIGGSIVTSSSPAALSSVNGGVPLPDLDSGIDDKNVQESQIYFYVLGSVLLVTGIITYLFWSPKRRRR